MASHRTTSYQPVAIRPTPKQLSNSRFKVSEVLPVVATIALFVAILVMLFQLSV